MSTVLYAGSFDPYTTGHHSIAMRALDMFDRVVIAVGRNERKQGQWPAEYRVRAIAARYAGNPRVEVTSYSGLTVDFARNIGAAALVRGVRDANDFAAERTLADTNRAIGGIDTVLLVADPDLAFVSSSMVRELMHFGHDASRYIAWVPQDPQ